MSERTRDDKARTSAEPQQPPRPPALRQSEESTRAREIDAIEADESLEGDQPVLEAVDTSGVARTQPPVTTAQSTETPEVDPLFGQNVAADFRSRWDVVQRSFVDDPQQAVRAGDELVSEVLEALSLIFAEQRTEFEKDANPDQLSTESLRLALRRYRSFFERLLTM